MNTSLEIYFCGREQCAAGHSFGPAVRPHYLIHFILSGKGRYHVNGDAYHLQAGDAFLIYPGETTVYEADEKNPWEYAWIGFGGIRKKHWCRKVKQLRGHHCLPRENDPLF